MGQDPEARGRMADPLRMRSGVRPVARAVIGFGLLLAWSYIVFFSRVVHYSTRNDISHLNSTYTFACCGMITVMLLAALPWRPIAAWLAQGHAGSSPDNGAGTPSTHGSLLLSVSPLAHAPLCRRLALGAGFLMCAATATLIAVESRLFTQPWCSIASTLAGIGLGLLYLLWATRLCTPSRAALPLRFVLAFLTGAAAFVVVLYLPVGIAHVVTPLLPVISALCLNTLPVSDDDRDGVTEPGAPLPRGGRIFWRALVCVGVLGFAESLERSLFLEVSPIDGTQTYRWVLLVAIIAAGAILLLASARKRGRAAITSVSHISMFAMALLFLLTPIVQGLGLAADLATMVCYALFYLLMWTLLAQIANAYRLPAHVCFGLGLGVAYAGCLVGTFAGSLLTSFVDMGWRLSCLLALCCAVLVLVSFLFIVDDRTIVELVDADDERPATPRRFMLRCEQLAEERGLTPRETEVMVLVAKGRSAQKIQEMLGLSAGTVNTYLAHIYKKLDVHARQELLDLLES